MRWRNEKGLMQYVVLHKTRSKVHVPLKDNIAS